jgi:C_GCAxxG_C_C family probable redox protein
LNHLEHAAALRNDQTRHYNCCQSVLIPFAEECGIKEETAYTLAAHFGAGMRRGATCGAVTGGLMTLGLLKKDETITNEFLRRFQAEAGDLDCAPLLKHNHDGGGDKKSHCDKLVFLAVRMVEELA